MIQTEPTPNPNALKFLPLREVRGIKGPLFYKKNSDKNPSEKSNIVNSLFAIKGVNDVFFGSDFITIGKDDSVQWEDIKEPIVWFVRRGHRDTSIKGTASICSSFRLLR